MAAVASGEWHVDVDTDEDTGEGVVSVRIDQVSDDGVECFVTNMPPAGAREFADALYQKAAEAEED